MKKFKPPKKKIIFKKNKKENNSGKLEPEISMFDERPRISFTESQLPGIPELNLKQKLKILIDVEVSELSEIDWGKDKGKLSAVFKINSAKFEE